MQTVSAASAVTVPVPGATPGTAVVGVSAGAAANDATSPFSSLVETLFPAAPDLQAGLLKATSSTGSASSTAASDQAAISAANDPTQLAATAATPSNLRIKAIVKSLAGEGDHAAAVPAQAETESPAAITPDVKIAGASDASPVQAPSRPEKPSQKSDDADASSAASSLSLNAPTPPLPALTVAPPLSKATLATQSGASASTPTITADSKAEAGMPIPGQESTNTGTVAQDLSAASAPSNQNPAGQSPAGQSLASQAPASQIAAPLPTGVDAQASQPTAPLSALQQPSAVAQFTGKARSASSSPPVAAKSVSSAGRAQGSSSSGPNGANDGGSALEPRLEVVQTAGAGDSNSQTGDQGAAADSAVNQDVASADPSGGDAVFQAPAVVASQTASVVDATPAASTVSDTIANLSAQIAQKAGGQTTRFDVQLDPLGLGRVNVSVEIDAKGAVTAALSFEKPEAASLLKSHSAELQQSLAQAGFDLSNASLSFATVDPDGRSASGQNAFLSGDGGTGQQSQGGQAQNAGRAFGAASLAADQADQIITSARTLSARGLDIRI